MLERCQMLTCPAQIVAADLLYNAVEDPPDDRPYPQKVYEIVKASFPKLLGEFKYTKSIHIKSRHIIDIRNYRPPADPHPHRAPRDPTPQGLVRRRVPESGPRASVPVGARDGQTAQIRGIPPDQRFPEHTWSQEDLGPSRRGAFVVAGCALHGQGCASRIP